MEIKFDKKTLRNLALLILGGLVVYWILNETQKVRTVYDVIMGVLSPFIVGAVLAFIFNVPMRAFEGLFKKVKNPTLRRCIALVLTLLAVLLVLTIVFLLLIPEVISTAQSLVPKLQAFVLNAEKMLDTFLADNPKLMQWIVDNTDLENFDWSALVQNALNIVGNSFSTLFSEAVSAIGSITSGIMNAFISLVFAVYALFQKETLARQGRKLLYAILPERISDIIVKILRLSNSTFSNFLSGQCVEVCILGCMFAIAMAIFGMPYIPLVSVLVAVTAFIPVVGAWVGCIVGAFLIFVSDPLLALWFVVMFVILQQIENNMIYPRVVGTSIGLSGMWVLVAVSIGGELMGVVGMFLMIPIASVLYSLAREWTHKRLTANPVTEEKLTPQPPVLKSGFKAKREKTKEKFARKKKEKQSLKETKE